LDHAYALRGWLDAGRGRANDPGDAKEGMPERLRVVVLNQEP
jgi:hypothetical protein